MSISGTRFFACLCGLPVDRTKEEAITRVRSAMQASEDSGPRHEEPRFIRFPCPPPCVLRPGASGQGGVRAIEHSSWLAFRTQISRLSPGHVLFRSQFLASQGGGLERRPEIAEPSTRLRLPAFQGTRQSQLAGSTKKEILFKLKVAGTGMRYAQFGAWWFAS